MGETTKIEWTDHTFNPWIGCSHVHTGCTNCYAEALSNRFGKARWGKYGSRVQTTRNYWRQPLKWNKAAREAGVRRRVFCASLADVFEDFTGDVHTPLGLHLGGNLDTIRAALFWLIDMTPDLDWLLLTKRPENIHRMWPGGPRPNVWLGTSVSDQATANKFIPPLVECRDVVPVLFVSYEPALWQIDFSQYAPELDWIIVGGESGPNARPFDVQWAYSTIVQCKDDGVACFVKQLGANVEFIERGCVSPLYLEDPKGGDPSEWPEDLRVREFPIVRHAHAG